MERAELARQAYLRAIAIARTSSTSRSWGRLLAAARNLRASIPGDVKRGAAARAPRAPGKEPPSTPSPGDAPRRAHSPASAITAVAPRLDGAPRAAAAGHHRLRWPGLEEDVRRARALRDQSRRLVMESRRLCAELAALLAQLPVRGLDATPAE